MSSPFSAGLTHSPKRPKREATNLALFRDSVGGIVVFLQQSAGPATASGSSPQERLYSNVIILQGCVQLMKCLLNEKLTW
jgi:hypothetical protein